ncbi:MAG: hypothetical protein ABFQ53_01525 [Patescibacteria group bacterium]
MSKQSKAKARRRKKSAKKKEKKIQLQGNFLPDYKKEKLRFVAYMEDDDVRNFSGSLCQINLNQKELPKVKYGEIHTSYTRVSIYGSLLQLPVIDKLLQDNSVYWKYFQSMSCRGGWKNIISDDSLSIVGTILHEEVDQFNGDLKFSNTGNEVETIFYQIPNNHRDVFVEIYADEINDEFIKALLIEDGWMSSRWKKHFQKA